VHFGALPDAFLTGLGALLRMKRHRFSPLSKDMTARRA
jgi:hypothetical protein